MNLPVKSVTPTDKDYPALLKEIPGRPERIYYLGELPTPADPVVAIVGTRKATTEGSLKAKEIASDLARAGITIVSGLALGIDGAAHVGALAGHGKTVAVLGNGIGEIYPKSHYRLAEEILANHGCIISEYPSGTPSYPSQFLERNRIVSGLSLGVVVIEAPIKSGALSTAKHALDQGREVFVVPGSARDRNYAGSHLLLRDGARLVTSADEVLEDLGLLPLKEESKTKRQKEEKIEDRESSEIFRVVREAREPMIIDKIIEIAKLEPQIVNQKLTLLTLEGLIEERNGKFSIKK